MITRRKFLGTLAAGAAAGATFGSAAKSYARIVGANDRLNFAIIGLNGIYSFPLIHSTNPEYEPITSNALGPDPEVHKAASPASYPPSAFAPPCSAGTAHGLRHIVLAASHDDQLVPWDQVECMRDVFADDGETDVEVRVVEVKGDHNDCWREGDDVAWVVSLTVKVVLGMGM